MIRFNPKVNNYFVKFSHYKKGTFLLLMLLLGSCLPSHSQQCTTDSLLLNPPIGSDIPYSDPGFINPNNLPCVQTGTYSELVIPFNNYDQGARLLMLNDSNGVPIPTIHSIKVESISNLPAGLCWTMAPANGIITGEQTGALIIKGTSTVATGVYPISVKLSLDVLGNGTYTYTGMDAANYKNLLGQVILKVMDSSFNCPVINQ